ncbi:MAG: hypothetical protein QW584_00355 [Thermofilaceae archaeon]
MTKKAGAVEQELDKETVLGNLLNFEEVRKSTILLYGRPMTGKTLLTVYEAARLAKLYGGGVLLVVSEPNYSVKSLQDAISSIISSMNVSFDVVYEKFADRIVPHLYHLIREEQARKEEEGKDWVPKYRVAIVDSLRSIAMAEQSKLSYIARKQTRTLALTGIRSSSWVVWNLSSFADAVDGWAFAIASATSTVGTGLYQGLVSYTPSLSEKALHDVASLIWLGSSKDFPEKIKSDVKKMGKKLKDVRIAVTVIHRSMPAGDGIVFEFTKASNFVKPVPLFRTKYEYEEEEDIV